MSGFLADSQVGLQTRRSTGDCGDNLPAFVAKTVWKQLKVKKKKKTPVGNDVDLVGINTR